MISTVCSPGSRTGSSIRAPSQITGAGCPSMLRESTACPTKSTQSPSVRCLMSRLIRQRTLKAASWRSMALVTSTATWVDGTWHTEDRQAASS